MVPLGRRCNAYEGDKGSLDEDELASALRRGAFGLIRRDRAREETISDTGDDSRDQHHGVIDGGGLQDRANNHDTSTSGRQDDECVRTLPTLTERWCVACPVGRRRTGWTVPQLDSPARISPPGEIAGQPIDFLRNHLPFEGMPPQTRGVSEVRTS